MYLLIFDKSIMKMKLTIMTVVIFLLFTTTKAFSATYDWQGGTSTAWTTASNWYIGASVASTYPGQGGATGDIVYIGVNRTITNNPTLSASLTIASLTLGTNGNGLNGETLTVNSTYTLTIAGNIQQNFLATSSNGTNDYCDTFIQGAGAIVCGGNFVFGDGTAPAAGYSLLFALSSQITHLTIDGNLDLNATGPGAGSGQNYPYFSNDIGTVTLLGQIVTTTTGNPQAGYYDSQSGNTAFPGIGQFITNTYAYNSPTTLELRNKAPIASPVANFYIYFDGGGANGTVIYDDPNAENQTVYTSTDADMYAYSSTYPDVYCNLTLSGTSTKVPTGGSLAMGYYSYFAYVTSYGNFTTSGGAVNLSANNPAVSIYNNWTNSTTVNQGSGSIMIISNFGANSVTLNSPGIINLGSGTFTDDVSLVMNPGTTVNGHSSSATAAVAGTYTNTGAQLTCNYESMTFTGAANNAGGVITGGNGTLTFGSTYTNTSSGAITTGAGTATFTGNYTNTLGSLATGSGSALFDGNYTVSNTACTFTAGTGTVYFSGTANQALIDNSANGTAFNNVTFNSSQTVTMSPGVGNFAVAPGGVLTMAGSTKLVAGDNNTGSVFASPLSTADSYLTLQSNASGSAAVAAIPATASITGNVNVQRYITAGSGYRGYRLVSSPVNVYNTGYTSINYPINNCYVKGSTGTAGGFDAGGNPNIYLYRDDLAPSNASFTSGNWRGLNAINNSPAYSYSFDGEGANYYLYPGTGFLFFFRGNRSATTIANESLTTYTPTATTLTATGVLNQQAVAVKYWHNTSAGLDYTHVAGNSLVVGFNSVGNPYASTIDLNTASTTAGSGLAIGPHVETNFYELNQVSQVFGVWSQSLGLGTNNASQYIVSGQGFFVKADTSGQALTFNEAAKVSAIQNTSPKLFMTTRADMARINVAGDKAANAVLVPAKKSAEALSANKPLIVTLQKPGSQLSYSIAVAAAYRELPPVNNNASTSSMTTVKLETRQSTPVANNNTATASPQQTGGRLKTVPILRLQLAADSVNKEEILLAFNPAAKFDYSPGLDAIYQAGSGLVRFSSRSADDISLAINQMPYPKARETIVPLNVWGVNSGTYTLNLKGAHTLPKLFDLWLMDAYKKDSLDIKDNSSYVFDLNLADTGSYGHNRFSLVIRENPARMVHLLKFAAIKTAEGNEVNWNTENEANYTGFDVERSTDAGATFNNLGNMMSNAEGAYNYLDKSPANGVNTYRLKITDLNGTVSYSSAATIMYANTGSQAAVNGLMLFPNPTAGMINLSISTGGSTGSATRVAAARTNYNIQIVNNLGAVVKSAQSSSPLWQSDVSSLSPGTYFIRVIDTGNNAIVGKSAFVKM
jgi:hypothetical protein